MISQWYNHYCFSMETDMVVFNSTQTLYFFKQYLSSCQIVVDQKETPAGQTTLKRVVLIFCGSRLEYHNEAG